MTDFTNHLKRGKEQGARWRKGQAMTDRVTPEPDLVGRIDAALDSQDSLADDYYGAKAYDLLRECRERIAEQPTFAVLKAHHFHEIVDTFAFTGDTREAFSIYCKDCDETLLTEIEP